jgi:cytidylate kinase
MGENIVITIARQYGSGGKTIGAMLAKELGINCYSREILKMASEESGINEGLFGMSDEKIKKAPWFKILSRPYDGELLTPEDRDFVSDDNLFNYQAKVIRDLAEKESCVIVGRCADYIFRDHRNVLNIYIYAPVDARYKNCVEVLKMKPEEATKMIYKVDKARTAYHKRYAKYAPGDLDSKQIMIDSSMLGVKGTAEVLAEIVQRRFGL